jgi:hypothetical protein
MKSEGQAKRAEADEDREVHDNDDGIDKVLKALRILIG